MKLIDAIHNVTRPTPKSVWEFEPPTDAICSALRIDEVWDHLEAIAAHLRAYPVFNWLCTDEYVGLDALWLDNEPVASIWRSARKNSYEIKWVSRDAADKARTFLLSFQEATEYDLIGADEEFHHNDFGASVDYVGQLLTDDGFYQGRPVKVLVQYDWLGATTKPEHRRPGHSYCVRVDSEDEKSDCLLVQDGSEERLIPVSDFIVPFNVQEPA